MPSCSASVGVGNVDVEVRISGCSGAIPRLNVAEGRNAVLVERSIDFRRPRHMLCRRCSHQWVVNLEWIERWNQALEKCPGCGMTCEYEDSPRFTVAPDDPTLDSQRVPHLAWYHTSTQPDWPTKNFDPAAELTTQTVQMMGGEDHVRKWAAKQRAKALHVGTYEAAVHNMLRRIHDQADSSRQFYLYRVHLEPSVIVREDWLIDPSNLAGDVILADVCPPGIDAARYLNCHEDPGGLSLALGREAILSTQRLSIPLHHCADPKWMEMVGGAIQNVAQDSPISPSGSLARFRRLRSPRVEIAGRIAAQVARGIPVNLRDPFLACVAFQEESNPTEWADRVA